MCVRFRYPPKSEVSTEKTSESRDEKKKKLTSSSPPPSPSGGPPSFFISFTESASDEVIQYVVKQLEGQDLQCELLSEKSSRSLAITGGLKVLAKQVFLRVGV